MASTRSKLSGASVAVLEMIAAGNNYDQILGAYPGLTYLDVFRAAEEALKVCAMEPSYTLEEKRERYPRAYEKWTDDEDNELRGLVKSGETVARIAGRLQRNRGAICSRIVKLNLVDDLVPSERARLERIEGQA